jgi:hypothetical protein
VQRRLSLATMADRVPLPPADSLGFRFTHICPSWGSRTRVFITDGRPESFLQ